MEQKKLGDFEIINQVKIASRYLICEMCKNWLYPPIYKHPQRLDYHYCENCVDLVGGAESDESDNGRQVVLAERNPSLEQILSNFLYPCMFAKCDAIKPLMRLQKHAVKCWFAPFDCHLCDSDIVQLDDTTYVDHLINVHSDIVKKILADEPKAVLKLDSLYALDSIFVLECNRNTFVVQVEFNVRNHRLSFIVGKQNMYLNAAKPDQFKIKYTTDDNITMAVLGNVCSFRECVIKWCTERMQAIEIPNDVTDSVALTISFNNYKPSLKQLIGECVICLNPLKTRVRQCLVGHSVCTECGIRIDTCATCRMPMIPAEINLKYVLSDDRFLCPNAASGCLQIITDSQRDAHAIACIYKQFKCLCCMEKFTKSDLLVHGLEDHDFNKNMEIIECEDVVLTFSDTYSTFIVFDDELFKFIITVDIVIGTIGFNLYLLFNDDKHAIQKYRYEVHVLDSNRSTIAMTKMNGQCRGPIEDFNVTSSIHINYLKSCTFPNATDDQNIFYLRCCIFEISDNAIA